MTYIRFPLSTNPEDLAQEVFAYIQTKAPNWTPQEGNLDVWIVRAVVQLASEVRDIVSDVQDDIFRWFGATIMSIQPALAVPARAFTTWTLTDTNGHRIPAGTNVLIRNSLGDPVPFTVQNDVIVPNGNSATSAGEVVIVALDAGTDANNLGGAGVAIELIDVIDWVNTSVMTGITAGGEDDEDDPTYLNRLVKRIRRLSLRPILPQDFADLALEADPLLARVIAIDGYNPGDSTFNNERMVTVAGTKVDGTAASSGMKINMDTMLQANREINFVVNEMDPHYTTINVTTTVVALPGYITTDVQASITAAIQQYFSAVYWGADPTVQEGAGVPTTWIETPIVYYNEVITAISNVTGVSRVTALTLNGTTADVNLTTPAALTTLGTLTVTVT